MQNTPQLTEAVRNAVAFHRQGNLAAAESLYQSVLAQQPQHLEALHCFGLLRLQQQRPADALALLDRALSLDPHSPDVLVNAAGALMALGRPVEALERLDALLELRPADADAHFNRGVLLAALGRNDEAIPAYRAAISIQSGHWPAMFNLGNEQAAAGHYADALTCYDKVLAVVPNHADVLNNSGNALLSLARPTQALERFNRVLALTPGNLRALTNRASALKELRRYAEALADYDRVLAANPDDSTALYNSGNALIDVGRPDEAIRNLRRALALRPEAADAAVADVRRAPNDPDIHTSLIFALNFDSSSTTADQQAERTRWAKRYEALPAASPSHVNLPDPDRRLRIGYVSPYFRGQSATYCFGGVLTCHDREHFDVVCYSDTQDEDDISERLRASAGTWHRTASLSDHRLAELVRADGIDILVDPVGHMRGHRLALFARKPAPVQVTAWGEPTGTGLRQIDYLFADPVLVPAAERELLAERVFDLPNFLGFWTPDPLPEPGALPARPHGHITFGSFNRLAKVLEPVLRAWAHILRGVPNSRLVLKDRLLDHATQQAPILSILAAEGIAAERVTLLDQGDRASHFAAYQQIDIALDPFPHGGGMTTLDALWMGVPVITWPGRTISSRLAAATLTALGLAELIAPDLERYVALAIATAADLDALAGLRAGLRPRVANSAIGDPARYARAVEAAYREMWRRWCASR
jgi:predicted O-linked N-acetylglucosamine transferase (SPINDLY family)